MGKGDKSSGSNTDPESYVLKAMSHVIWTDRSLLNWSTVSGFCQIMSSPVVRVDRGYAGLSEPEVSPALSLWSLLSLDSGLCLRPGSSPDEGMSFVFQPLLLWTWRLIWRHGTHFLLFPELTVMSLWMLLPTKDTSLSLQSVGCLGPSQLFHGFPWRVLLLHCSVSCLGPSLLFHDTHPSHIWRHMTLNNRKAHADGWERTTVKSYAL